MLRIRGGLFQSIKALSCPTNCHTRMNQTMEKLKKMEAREYSILTRVLFGLDTPTSVPRDRQDFDPEIRDMDFIDKTLNDSQKDAIRFALVSREVALIHGPPGVGLPQAQVGGARVDTK